MSTLYKYFLLYSFIVVPPAVGDSDTYSGSTGTGVGNDWVEVQARGQGSLA